MSIAREIDMSVVQANLEEIGQDIAAMLRHVTSATGACHIMPTDIVPPSDVSERLGLLVWAYSLLRCRTCGQFADMSVHLCSQCVGRMVARES